MNITGTVTQSDIDRADRDNLSLMTTHCVLATALKRMFPELTSMEVGYRTATLDGKTHSIDADSTHRIVDWVSKKPIKPFDFTLTPWRPDF